MSKINENKKSFFVLSLYLTDQKGNEIYHEKLNNAIDLVLGSMSAVNGIYQFKSKNESEFIYYFQIDQRKRKGQIIKQCERYLPQNQEFRLEGLTKSAFNADIFRLTKNENFELLDKPQSSYEDYQGQDIKIFDDPRNWYPWQRDIYEKVFEPNGQFKKPDPRRIISLIDKKGNSGKSSFFKWLFYRYQTSIGRITLGSSSQLRSCALNLGAKQFYIIDLPRSRGTNDREQDLLSIVEELKSGIITNAMYGNGNTLLMDPPHVIISSNHPLKYEALSSDRWEVYNINSKYKLVEINAKRLEQKEKTIKK